MGYHRDLGLETPSLALHNDLTVRQQTLEQEFDGLAGFGIAEPDVYQYELPDRHQLVVVDESVQPYGAFKFVSSVASVLTVPEGSKEVVTVTAGNFGKTLGGAALRAGLRSRSYVPHDLNAVKHAGMSDTGMEVILAAPDVAGAMAPALAYVENTPGAVFLHPYNNRWGIASLRLLGQHVSDTMRKLDADGVVDLGRATEVLVPRGGGSGVAGIASYVRSARDAQDLPDNFQVSEVRPRRLTDGSLNSRFDGLRVEVPGSNTAPLLNDRCFVSRRHVVGEAAVADGSRLMAGMTEVEYEPNALVAVGAALQWVADNPGAQPKNFVAVLTGRNTDPSQAKYFKQLPGYTSTEEFVSRHSDRQRAEAARLARAAFASEVRVTHTVSSSRDHRRTAGAACLNGATIRSYVPSPYSGDSEV